MKAEGVNKQGVWGFYLVALIIFIFEGALVHFLVPIAGLGGTIALFVIGGFALGLWELRVIAVGEEFRDPLMRFGLWLWNKNPALGFCIHAGLTGASMGVAMVLKQMDHPHKLRYTALAAVEFAFIWVPLWHYVWR